MSNGNMEKSALEISIEKLNKFLEEVKIKYPDAPFKDQAEHALKYQGKFVELMKNFNFDPNIYNDLDGLRIRDGLSVSLHDALMDFIEFYEGVRESGLFTRDELQPAWEALKDQFNLTERIKENTRLDIHFEGVCGRRPKTHASPAEP